MDHQLLLFAQIRECLVASRSGDFRASSRPALSTVTSSLRFSFKVREQWRRRNTMTSYVCGKKGAPPLTHPQVFSIFRHRDYVSQSQYDVSGFPLFKHSAESPRFAFSSNESSRPWQDSLRHLREAAMPGSFSSSPDHPFMDMAGLLFTDYSLIVAVGL